MNNTPSAEIFKPLPSADELKAYTTTFNPDCVDDLKMAETPGCHSLHPTFDLSVKQPKRREKRQAVVAAFELGPATAGSRPNDSLESCPGSMS